MKVARRSFVSGVNTMSNRNTLSICQKSCAAALGYYSFGHEVASNMATKHDPEQSTNPYYCLQTWSLN